MTDPQRQLIAEIRARAEDENYLAYDGARDDVVVLLALIEEQDAALAGLPFLGDGARAIPNMEVYHPKHAGSGWVVYNNDGLSWDDPECDEDWGAEFSESDSTGTTITQYTLEQCFSTQQAAQAAAARGDEGSLLPEQREGEEEQR